MSRANVRSRVTTLKKELLKRRTQLSVEDVIERLDFVADYAYEIGFNDAYREILRKREEEQVISHSEKSKGTGYP